MLQLQLADSLARQRAHDLHADAELARTSHALRHARQHHPFRVRLGWWLVARGLRMAVWDRHTSPRHGSTMTAHGSLAARS